jgi:quercetin dioxygenase-like cupin family protein
MTVPHGTICRLIDFAPGMETPFHRSMSVDYGVVVEGEFKMTLDGGESKIMRPGDVTVNRACNHIWKNMSETRSGRMLFVLLDAEPLVVGGKRIQEDLGDLSGDYLDQEGKRDG